MIAHCTQQIDAGALACTCPDCRAELTPGEMNRISQDLRHRLEAAQERERKAREHARRQARQEQVADALTTLLDSEPELLEWATSGVAQVCPHCTTFVQRSHGCRHMTCRCHGQFCFACGGEWPCSKATCTDRETACLPIDLGRLRELRSQRRHAFLMGARCGAECHVSRLPPDVLRHVAGMIR